METLEGIKDYILAAVPGAVVSLVPNEPVPAQPSLLVDAAHGLAVAQFLRDDPRLLLDHCSNVTGVDWPVKVEKIKTKVKKVVDGVEKEVEETTERQSGGYLETVYHLYSMARKEGPVIIRLRTGDRASQNHLPSLTAVWRSCELQEREIYDLYGIQFDGHPDLRRILMWDGFQDHPMRKDYVEPDDYEYEPTPHDEVAARAKAHEKG
jgi:NADH-quinone oxidoreductase subunit C